MTLFFYSFSPALPCLAGLEILFRLVTSLQPVFPPESPLSFSSFWALVPLKEPHVQFPAWEKIYVLSRDSPLMKFDGHSFRFPYVHPFDPSFEIPLTLEDQ